ncbi:ABC transporter ATP-binding protein [Bordetella hinzii]|uniref:ABC transporter ATP-binding protein n=1 Tax=Bordetella hinzii TaxID=103855 RepID=A0AAN1VEW2_9BORD|nr:ABC transporter ATP-binding protein [Bordetella hinzii]AKQ54264.1 High-affinity branched-chain amino acid transport ATP-binding protein LivF [Bordetella hinzii]AKQ58778.1 High-affinity branched-chain amino acid transport ATP-binding protein LivF [Bordetella hinzii]AZW15940.1 ABC transporter ATP-binding protein [Bordetella hinzii]KCB30810.1 ABC transporter, ATP-binding protein [Bordetella hinzii L60]KCB49219.1 ABC transporter, ATP-binding protein [Bordetella hinzii 4161]
MNAASAAAPLLVIDKMAGGYGDVDIVSGIDLHVAPREIVTIAGTNGAGKSTLIKAVMGLLPRLSGALSFDGGDLRRLAVEDRVRIGISYVPQVQNVFGDLTVLENLQVVEHVSDARRRMEEMFELFPALARRRRTHAANLSGGERQQLAFARALMPSPRMVLLDEPSAALSPALTSQVFEEVQRLPGLDIAVLMVEQRARQALAFSDRGYILDSGRIVLTDSGANLLANEEMAELYIGQRHDPKGETA